MGVAFSCMWACLWILFFRLLGRRDSSSSQLADRWNVIYVTRADFFCRNSGKLSSLFAWLFTQSVGVCLNCSRTGM
ncbi:hypothetical protein V8F20_005252 [Naviculisporaceae sp. PSN 640]